MLIDLNILRTRKIIYSILFFTVLLDPFSFALSEILNEDLFDKYLPIKRKKIVLNKEYFPSNLSHKNNFLTFFDNNPKLVLNEPIKDKKELEIQSDEQYQGKKELEIQSDEQYQEKNVLYAVGNVRVTFKGNILKADKLVYDKFNGKFDAYGNIKFFIGKQIFIAEQINYDFKSQKGKLLKVKGLIKTKTLLDNININSSDQNEISSTLEEIRKLKVLHTPDGVNNWIFSTDELIVENNQWIAKKAFFTNDLLESDQVEFKINNLKITQAEEQLKIQSAISFLVLEDKIPIPFWFGKRTLNKSGDGIFLEPKWYIGTDKLDKDGYFIGRKLNPINITDDFSLKLDPQFLIERSIKGYTESFVNKGDSVTADRSRQDTSYEDYFALNSELKGKVDSWDLSIQKKLYSFDSQKIQNALRLKLNLSKEIDFLNSKWNKSFFGVYRDRVWNGSIGESEIYIGYGSKLEKQNSWEVDEIHKTEKISVGFGKFKGEALNTNNLVDNIKGSIFYSLDQKFPIIVKKSKNNIIDNSYRYIFEPVKQGIYLDTKISGLYSFYENGNNQGYVGFGAGPTFTFGEFKKKYFDYSKISLFPFYRLKRGDSVFKFDQISDQFTLNLSLDQQLYGPILLKTDATINLDSDADNYGDFINSKISLFWERRSYELGLFYQPHNKSGGISFTLHGFE